jgi:hypothetical protein
VTATSDLPAIYSSHPLVLWVEDEETRTYLSTAWQDGDIKLLVAGGYANIDTIVKAAEKDDIPWVFGVRDRDFWRSNRARWTADRALRVFTGDTFEIENWLLDATAMAACDVNTAEKDAVTLQGELDALAAPLAWWMSCRKTIVHFRDAVTKDSIEHPTRGAVTSKPLALSKIVGSSWWTTTLPALGQTVTEAEADRLLDLHHQEYTSALQDGTWRTCFSGKEILGEMRSRLWTRRPEGGLGGKLRLVRSIADAQRTLNRVPEEIQALHAVLRARVDLPP